MKTEVCHRCGKKEDEDVGSWEQTPYLFFCSLKCHEAWNDERYDSVPDTLSHIRRVQHLMVVLMEEMQHAAIRHDASKLIFPEKAAFDKYTPMLGEVTYGSAKYKKIMGEMRSAIDHHYENNRHHPEHHKKGIKGMTLFDIFEMFCDWKAASERHNDGSLKKSIQINKKRFGMSDELVAIFENTRREMGWE